MEEFNWNNNILRNDVILPSKHIISTSKPKIYRTTCAKQNVCGLSTDIFVSTHLNTMIQTNSYIHINFSEMMVPINL